MTKFCLSALVSLLLLCGAEAQEHGVISDPDGFTNLRAKPAADSAVVAQVKSGEVFEYESVHDSDWWKVTLKSGKSGWMHHTRIRCHFSLADFPEKDDEDSETSHYGKGHGFDYNATARGAAKGEAAAMQRFFGINDTDGGAAEGHAYMFNQVIHMLGDEKLATFLKEQPLRYRLDVRQELFDGVYEWPHGEEMYAERNFPQTMALLCRKELVDWASPDGKFAIRKTFSQARPTRESKVANAEVIDRATGTPVAEFTAEDMGRGIYREGRVLWGPDSKCFAHMSGALGAGGAAQTAVYRKTEDTFKRVPLAEVELPGRATDDELKGAKHLWRFVEPQRWESSEVLVLIYHDYFESFRPDRSIHSMGRTYEVTQNLATGKATAKVKRYEE